MPTVLTTKARERGTFVIDYTFFDENETSVVPNEVTWTLTDGLGVVVNGRSAVSVSPAATVTIKLTGLDLAVGDGLHDRFRRLLIEATYDSDLGSDLPYKDEVTFEIADFAKLEGIT